MGKRRGRAYDLGRGNIPSTFRGRIRVTTGLAGIAIKAKADPKCRFTSLAHILTPEFLKETWQQMNRRGASGVDGETCAQFERDLIAERVRAGIAHAKAMGKRIGRPPAEIDAEQVHSLRTQNLSLRKIAKALNVPVSRVRRALAKGYDGSQPKPL